MCELLSDVPDFACDYELLQLQFDRHILRCVTQKATLARARRCDTHTLTEHQRWSPGYWRRHHRVLRDLCHQLGAPDLFLTVSPYELHFPFPYWVEALHRQMNLGPTEAAAAETLAVAHAISQMCAGFLSGSTGHGKWVKHVFADKTGQSKGVRAFYGRLEFQHGGREERYGKGRGSVHFHGLWWFGNIRACNLETQLCAEFPEDDPELCALAQQVLKGDPSRAPLQRHTSSVVDQETEVCLLDTHARGKCVCGPLKTKKPPDVDFASRSPAKSASTYERQMQLISRILNCAN